MRARRRGRPRVGPSLATALVLVAAFAAESAAQTPSLASIPSAPSTPTAPSPASAPGVPDGSRLPANASIPVLSSEIAPGSGTVARLPAAFDPPHALGSIDSWQGQSSGFGGTTIYSHGEIVYQDHVFDAYGPTDQSTYQRVATLDSASALVPETYRLDPALQYAPGEFGIPTPPGQTLQTNYGVLPLQDEADLTQFRVAADGGSLWLLARTTTMRAPAQTAVVVLLGDGSTGIQRDVGFNTGIHTRRAQKALLLTGDHGWIADLPTGQITRLPAGSVASNPDGYVNSVQARISLAALGLPATFRIAAATGLADPSGAPALRSLGQAVNLANVAFRDGEPVRDYFDKDQAFSLYHGTIDPFFEAVDIARLRAGASERYIPGPGYHDRILASDPAISREQGTDGISQHYGIYLPSDYRPGRSWPVQWWFHFRGGNAHIAATLVPGLVRDLGENQHSIFISPDGRGTSRWYVGKGMVDYQEIWNDVHHLLPVDRNREYISGHSMGGWATYLLSVLYPDRWAAGLPASAPPTQGAWTGIDVPNCDSYSFQGETPCYTSANGGDPRGELTTPLLSNIRQVPLAIYQGVPDELVPSSGELMQARRLQDLGYRYRYYAFPAQEHYGPPIVDQWAQGARYEHRFVRDPNPPRVTYTRSMVFEHDVNTINADGVALSYHFDRAYWMSDLQPVDPVKGVASFDGRSLAITEQPHIGVPEAGGPATPGQTGPYAMFGQRWLDDPLNGPSTRQNAFQATLTGARAVDLDVDRMNLSTSRAIAGAVTADGPVALTLAGPWPRDVKARLDGQPLAVRRVGGHRIAVTVPAGTHQLSLDPGA